MQRIATAIVCAIALASSAVAQDSTPNWPTRPITFVVPFPPGPGLDFVARLVGEKVSPAVGQPVLYEYRTGANGKVASESVARAAPDGYTVMVAATSTHATNVHLTKNLGYDPVKQFTPIITSVETIGCLAINTKVLPVNTVAELIEYAKKNPAKLSYGSSGVGSFFHLAGELFNQTAGVKLNHVPYRGSVAAFDDLVGGHVPINFTQINQALAFADNTDIKILAVLETTRFVRAPGIPSITETLPGFRMPASWNGFVGPAGMAVPVVGRLNLEIGRALNDRQVHDKLESGGYRVADSTPEEFGKRIRDDIELYGPIIRSVGIQLE